MLDVTVRQEDDFMCLRSDEMKKRLHFEVFLSLILLFAFLIC